MIERFSSAQTRCKKKAELFALGKDNCVTLEQSIEKLEDIMRHKKTNKNRLVGCLIIMLMFLIKDKDDGDYRWCDEETKKIILQYRT